MNWKEIEEEFEMSGKWIEYMASTLALNAAVEYRRRDNIRNYYDDEYNYNYESRYTPVFIFPIITISKFKLKQ